MEWGGIYINLSCSVDTCYCKFTTNSQRFFYDEVCWVSVSTKIVSINKSKLLKLSKNLHDNIQTNMPCTRTAAERLSYLNSLAENLLW